MKILMDAPTKINGGLTTHTNGIFQAALINPDINILGIDFSRDVLKPQTISKGAAGKIITYPLPEDFFKRLYYENSLKAFNAKMKNKINIFESNIISFKPDLIMINGTTWKQFALFCAAKKFNIPVIQYHGSCITNETKHYPKYVQETIKKIECSYMHPVVKMRIFPSQIIKTTLEDQVWKKKSINSIIIHSGVRISEMKINPGAGNYSVGMVCRWSPEKNPNYIVELADFNRKKNGPLTFNIVSELEANHSNYEKASESCIVFTPMAYDLLVDFYRNCSVIICPSLFETYGRVPLEAVAHGVPALVSHNMGVAEVYKKVGLADLIVDFNDVNSVYKKIISLKNYQIPREIVNEIRQYYSEERVYGEYMELFRSVANHSLAFGLGL